MNRRFAWTLICLIFLPLGWSQTPVPPAAPPPAPDPTATRSERINAKINAELPDLENLYRHLHSHPELSGQEVQTAGRMARELKDAGFEVSTGIGGHGVVGVLRNGPGPTVLVRTDLDALPITENTGLPFASKVRVRDKVGNDVGVMHACGHDIHMSTWVGVARTLTSMKDAWSGTLVFIGQPAEETGTGARTMLEDGLLTRFPKPDFALALHSDPKLATGKVTFTDGPALASVDSVDILVRGVGGHGASPHLTVDPVVLAARIVLDLQTIISREVDPVESAVITVGSIHGGTKHNIIPSEVRLQVTVRAFDEKIRDHVLKAIERVVKAAAVGARAPEPEVRVDMTEWTPSTINETALTRKTVSMLKKVIGEQNVVERKPIMGGEDFGRYGRAGVPIFMYFLGTIPPEKIAAEKAGQALPTMHSEFYFPDPGPSIRTGVFTMSHAVLNLLGK